MDNLITQFLEPLEMFEKSALNKGSRPEFLLYLNLKNSL